MASPSRPRTPRSWPARSTQAKAAGIPVLTWDSDLLPENADLRIAYVGTKNYDIGVNLAKIVQEIKPDGGTICIQSGGAAAANHNERMQGIRDTLGGMSGTTSPGEQLTGENGWTEVDGCPLYTDDDFPRSVQQMEDILAKYPGPRRVRADRRLPAVRAGRLPQRRDQGEGPDRQQGSGARGRRHLAGADGPDEGRALARPGRSAPVRDGLQDHALPAWRSRRTARTPRIRPTPASTSARPRPPTAASAAEPRLVLPRLPPGPPGGSFCLWRTGTGIELSERRRLGRRVRAGATRRCEALEDPREVGFRVADRPSTRPGERYCDRAMRCN